jgi:K+-transporting ATPase ATPase C chain
MNAFVASLRVVLLTLLICAAGYTLAILGVARAVTAGTASGSLVVAPDGRVIGSRLIAQDFTQPRYFWQRPSAVGYNGAGAGGSNKSPTSRDLTGRAREAVERFGASAEKPLPAELAAASGGGLDPHITARAAMYQAERVAAARGLARAQVEQIVGQHAFAPGGFLTPDRLVNVLELNLALDVATAE